MEENTKPDADSVLNKLSEISRIFEEAFDNLKKEEEEYWNSLSKDDQLKAFCAVVRRICLGELQDKGSYRYVLYNTFGFGTEAYARAQMAGYLELHNSIYDADHDEKLLRKFCEKNNIEHSEEKIQNFFTQHLLT